MDRPSDQAVTGIEVVEDVTARSRCDEGFLHVKRLVCRNRHADGSTSRDYRVDVVDRPIPDAVAVLIWRRGPAGPRSSPGRPCGPRPTSAPPCRSRCRTRVRTCSWRSWSPGCWSRTTGARPVSVVAPPRRPWRRPGSACPRTRCTCSGSFFLAPGILSEKIHPTAVEVTGRPQETPEGDGSPLEDGATLHWWPIDALLEACRTGAVEDAKTELLVGRFLAQGVRTTPAQRP